MDLTSVCGYIGAKPTTDLLEKTRMAELRPYPFGALIRRMFHELEHEQAIFDLPAKKFFLGDPAYDLSVELHGRRVAAPFGPAAGPHTQMAQNIVLAWLAGGRIFELKTVQILDELQVPRPCIDMQTVGFNVEWSQELKLQQSLEEYVKASMLLRILEESGKLELALGFERAIIDMSVGYDLKGIKSEPVQAFIAGMRDAGDVVDRLRGEIPDAYKQYRDLDFATELSNTLTLSTFHGCPPEEIEKIIEFLLEDLGLSCIVKLNPTLLGPERARGLLNHALGYDEIYIPDSAFENDTKWEQAVGFVGRLRDKAAGLGLGLGVKLTNTLLVQNNRDFFSADEKEMYLSGAPLHVLAMRLVRRFRREFGGDLPISFSAGIDGQNFSDAVALGLVPITVCTDLLKPGGYGRASGYFRKLTGRMDTVGAKNIDDYILRAYGHAEEALEIAAVDAEVRESCQRALQDGGDSRAAAGDAFSRWVAAAKVLNTESYVGALGHDERYGKAKNDKPPKKIGSHLVLFDCITCDKCIPVCPNDANFRFVLPQEDIPIVTIRQRKAGWVWETSGSMTIEQKHQLGNFADFCNECGNCGVFCPEDGGPYKIKPSFFGSLSDWREFGYRDGFFLAREDGADLIHGRFDGVELAVELRDQRARYTGPGFELEFAVADPEGTMTGTVTESADFTYFSIIQAVHTAVTGDDTSNYVKALLE